MHRRFLVACLAAIGAVLLLIVDAGARPEPKKGSEIYAIMKVRLYQVDEAFHNKLAKARWLSKAKIEELETTPQADHSLFTLLKKETPFMVGKGINIGPGKEGVLMTATKPIKSLPAPDQLRLGKKAPQTNHEGFTLSAQVHISADRRFVRAKFLEKSLEIEGIEKATVVVDDRGTEAVGEIVSVKEASLSQARYIPDGGSILLLLHYRPPAVKKKGRWLVAEITPQIYIEEEERERRGKKPK